MKIKVWCQLPGKTARTPNGPTQIVEGEIEVDLAGVENDADIEKLLYSGWFDWAKRLLVGGWTFSGGAKKHD